jgi:hypothetical protein
VSHFSNFAENKLIDHLLRATAYPVPTAIYVGLFTTPSSDAGPGTEVSGGSYARVQVGPGLASWTATQGGTAGVSTGTTGISTNVADITFPAPTAAWGTITHFGLFDAVTGGNLLMQNALAVPKVVSSGDQAPKFPAAGLSIQID